MFVPEVRRPIASTSIVGEGFCFPYLVDLTVKKKIGLSRKHIDVLDDNGSMLVQVEGGFWQFKKKRTLYDSVGAPIITLRQKVTFYTGKSRWRRGGRSPRPLKIFELFYIVFANYLVSSSPPSSLKSSK